MYPLTKKREHFIIRSGLILFWLIFWGLNVIDTFIGQTAYLWVGKDRLSEFVQFFSSIGIVNPLVAQYFLIVTTILQIITVVFLIFALIRLWQGSAKQARANYFWGTFIGLVMFSYFTIGDQMFGGSEMLWQHTMYWLTLVISWGAYTTFTDS